MTDTIAQAFSFAVQDLYWFGGGLVLGLLLGWLVARVRAGKIILEKTARVAAAESQLGQLDELRDTLARREAAIAALSDEITELKVSRSAIETLLGEARQNAQEKIDLLKDLQQNLKESYQSLAADALHQNSRAFLELADQTLGKHIATSKQDLETRTERIKAVVQPVHEALGRYAQQVQSMERLRESAYGSLENYLKSLSQSQAELQLETGRLARAMRVPHVRGRWGEITLKRTVELAGMSTHCDFDEQATISAGKRQLRPDMVVHMPAGRQVAIDAKVPLAAYLEALEADNEQEIEKRLEAHAGQMASHVQQLSQKAYWQHLHPSTDFVVLFIPGENFFAAALAKRPDLMEFAAERKVILATPATLISLLRSVALGWQQAKAAESARIIAQLGKELYDRLATMTTHMAQMGRDIDRSMASYNRMVGALNRRVLVSARKFTELGVHVKDEAALEDLEPLENTVRSPESGEVAP
jgi:DNA recombination protein RmuC